MNIEHYAKKYPKTKPAIILNRNLQLISNLPENSRILDIGCAEGNTIEWISSLCTNKLIFYGIDLSKNRIYVANSKRIPGTFFQLGDAEKLPFTDNYFDFVISSQVIEHVHNERRMISEVNRVLSPGSCFQIDTIFKKKWAWYFRRSAAGWVLDPTHLREYTNKDSLLNLISSFLIIEDVRFDKLYYRFNILKFLRWLPDRAILHIPGYYKLFLSGRKIR